MVRVTLKVSPLAKAAVLGAMAGMGLVLYGMHKDVSWAGGVGTVLFFGGAITWYIERYRMYRKRKDGD